MSPNDEVASLAARDRRPDGATPEKVAADEGATGRPETSVLQAVRQAVPFIASRQPYGEVEFRLDPDVVRVLGATKAFRMLIPEALGGPGCTLSEVVRVLEALGSADASAAWTVLNSSVTSQLLVRLGAATALELMLPDDRLFAVGIPPTGVATPVQNGFRITGRWPVVTGSLDASWFWLNCTTVPESDDDRDSIKTKIFAIAACDVTVEETWRGAAALRGSASNEVRVQEVFVKSTHSTFLFGGTPLDRPIDELSRLEPLAVRSLTLAAIAVGITRAARDAAIEQAASRVSQSTGGRWASWPSVQETVASSDIAVEGLRSLLFEIADSCIPSLQPTGLDVTSRARVHTVADHVFRVGRRTVSNLFTLGSIDALRSGHTLERCLRDIHGLSVQWERYRNMHYRSGAALLGLDL